MEFLQTFYNDYPFISWCFIILGSLCIGSFLNVVIYRLPRMLDREWRTQCHDFLKHPPLESSIAEPFNLIKPNSSCPHCHKAIKPWHNIPVLSFLFLRGKCSACGHAISLRYPFTETFTAISTVAIVMQFGFTSAALFACVITWLLIALSSIDLDHQILPDNLVYSVLWLGLIANLSNCFTDMDSAIWGAVIGYGSFWLIAYVFKRLTHKEGLGQGDFKLLAALGACLGWQLLPFVILIASVLGLALGLPWLWWKYKSLRMPLPFGPFLALGGWVGLFLLPSHPYGLGLF